MTISTHIWDKILSLIVISLLAVALWPASYWFEVRSVMVDNAKVGEPIYMTVDQEVHYKFDATRYMTIRRKVDDEHWEFVCYPQVAVDYDTYSNLPLVLTLQTWTNHQCPRLGPGSYKLHNIWQLEPKYSPTKRITAVSNQFEVIE